MPKCLYCGKEIMKKSHKKGTERKYCDVKCYNAALGRKTASERFGYAFCKYCGSRFKETRDRPNIFCSISCSGKYNQTKQTLSEALDRAIEEDYNRELLKEYKAKLKEMEKLRERLNRERRCQECGKYFEAEHGAVYCSDRCRKRVDNRRRDKRLYRNGKPDMSISLTKLFMRDRGICQICGKELDFDGDPNGDDYPSIDHIRPLAKGGLHEWGNVQLACRRCNSMKRDEWDD